MSESHRRGSAPSGVPDGRTKSSEGCRKPLGRFRSCPEAGGRGAGRAGGDLTEGEGGPEPLGSGLGCLSPGRPVRHRVGPARPPAVSSGRPFTGSGSTQDGGHQSRWWLRGAARSHPAELRVRAWVGTLPRDHGGERGPAVPALHARGGAAPGPWRLRPAAAMRVAGLRLGPGRRPWRCAGRRASGTRLAGPPRR